MEEKADKSKIFDTVLSTLKETRTAFFANFISGFALMLSAFGLILGYEKIKPIVEIDAIYYFSVIILLFFSYTYTKYLLNIKKKTKRLVSQLDELKYMDNHYYKDYEIATPVFLPMLASILVMFFVMILVLSWIKYFAIIPG
jgi:hypothetical protein